MRVVKGVWAKVLLKANLSAFNIGVLCLYPLLEELSQHRYN